MARAEVGAKAGDGIAPGGARRHILVAFQGARGAFGEVAIEQYWRGNGPVRGVARVTFEAVADAVARGAVDAGVLPVANTIVGDIRASLDALGAHSELVVAGETVVAVDLALIGVPGVGVADIQTVASHPVALAQCGAWLARHPSITSVPAYDSAGAAETLAEHRDRRRGVIAGQRVAVRYGLAVIEADVADRQDNTTRFVVVVRRART